MSMSLICLMGRKTWSEPMQVGITGLSNGNPPVSVPPGPQSHSRADRAVLHRPSRLPRMGRSSSLSEIGSIGA